ncbi:hypothetical protein C6499_12085 [Candidatus Poribacteria bacterium]|nr:MAG: hypothetical protein C6499_12085 [Candidatus Poribacteria bacterium]
MSQDKIHDLYDFMNQTQNDISEEYDRIQKRVLKDPSTAGDQGEENWAELLRGWLPRTYQVVTKGRIISQDGRTSPQIDVLVLKSVYPKKLLNKKLYLAAGVAAAFECKITLRAEHIEKAVKTCAEIKNLYPVREGTPYKELYAPIVYGLLAHSHSWKNPNSTPEENITQKLWESDNSFVSHPRLSLDLLCVASLTSWSLISMPFTAFPFISKQGNVMTHHTAMSSDDSETQTGIPKQNFTPIGYIISHLWNRLAREDSSLRDLAHYYMKANISGVSSTKNDKIRLWKPDSVYAAEVLSGFGTHGPLGGESNYWSEWFSIFS